MSALARARHRLMHFYFRIARPMTLGVRAIVIDTDARVLLVRHTYVAGWHLPGGGVEVGESMLEAVHREVLEEGNVRMTVAPQLHGLYFNRRASPRDHVAVFVAREFEVLGPHAPNREIAAADFFPLAALPDGATRATRARLEEALGGREPDPYW
jgi:ADP-ribose pyrophosphatase YjhB (NUDIX family)